MMICIRSEPDAKATAATLVGTNMIFVTTANKKIYGYDLETNEWILELPEMTEASHGLHSVCAVGTKLYVFNGSSDTIQVLDLESHQLMWQTVIVPQLSTLDLSNPIVVQQSVDKMLVIGEDKANNRGSVQLLDLACMQSREVATCNPVSLQSLKSAAAQVSGTSDMVALVKTSDDKHDVVRFSANGDK